MTSLVPPPSWEALVRVANANGRAILYATADLEFLLATPEGRRRAVLEASGFAVAHRIRSGRWAWKHLRVGALRWPFDLLLCENCPDLTGILGWASVRLHREHWTGLAPEVRAAVEARSTAWELGWQIEGEEARSGALRSGCAAMLAALLSVQGFPVHLEPLAPERAQSLKESPR